MSDKGYNCKHCHRGFVYGKAFVKHESSCDKKKDPVKFIEICAGAGGMSSGFINKGYKPVLLNDFDKHCCNTLEKNHTECGVEVVCKSFVDINFSKYKNIDLIIGGVPCQSFSQAGKRKGLDDTRGNLMMEFIKLIKNITPKAFVIENVKGLTTHENGKTLKTILDKLNSINKYNVHYKVLNSNNYDVAQKRERLLIVGIRKDINTEYEFPEEQAYKPVLKDVLQDVPESEGYTYPQRKKEIMDMIPQGGCWINLPEDIQKEYMKASFNSGGGKRGIARRLSMEAPSLTLTTSPCQKQTERCHPLETRPLKIREYARIQSFPDNYEFTGSVAQQYKQIGNAVPVKLAEHLANSLLKIF